MARPTKLFRRTCLPAALAAACCLAAAAPDGAPIQTDADVDVLRNAVNERLGLLDSQIITVSADRVGTAPIETQIAIDGRPLTLSLEPQSTRAPGYQLLVQIEDGSLVSVQPGIERTFRGEISEVPGSVVAASMLDDGLHARIIMPDGEQF